MTLLTLYLTFGYLYAAIGVHETTMKVRYLYSPEQSTLATVAMGVLIVTLIWPVLLYTNRGWTWVKIPNYDEDQR